MVAALWWRVSAADGNPTTPLSTGIPVVCAKWVRRRHVVGMDTSQSVLLATTNEALLDDLLRLAAAASITPVVEPDLRGLRRSWHSCSLVVVGRDLAVPLAR